MGGWIPRFRRYGIGQIWPFLKWLLNKDTFISLFVICFFKLDPARQIKPALKELLKALPKENQNKK